MKFIGICMTGLAIASSSLYGADNVSKFKKTPRQSHTTPCSTTGALAKLAISYLGLTSLIAAKEIFHYARSQHCAQPSNIIPVSSHSSVLPQVASSSTLSWQSLSLNIPCTLEPQTPCFDERNRRIVRSFYNRPLLKLI